ncbi:DUF4097 family beta strand repeat-containing protein [Asanoa sp. WMMD1127]|uniref:DUF4097 family beta strand repeat-containing protein n=1 Tax=Asanoa sp. WMMD1127 TaxID=3016107 RepID=UPI002416DDCC|nr:DUF4097 family beta strand repeat-containing protein [Asanoa sp. WMMD1127]MDG4823079.1 DUF4097 family beta strand repeat-containing protein [Asanoa sp. WMMD1127]
MSNRWTVEEPREIAVEAAIDRVDVNLVSGQVNLVGTDDGPARVDVTRAGRTPVIVEVVDRTLVVRHNRLPRFPGVLWWIGQLRRRFRVDVSIGVPRSTAAYLRLVDGAVVVAGLRDDTEVDLTSGRITLMGLGGRTRAKVVAGPVEALGVDGDLTLKTVSGELVLADSSADRVEMTTVSGSVTCDLDNPHHRELRLHTTSGSVTVRVRADADLAVDLHTQSGQITSAFPLAGSERHGASRHRRGDLGRGTGKLWATTVSGSIALLASPVDEEGETPE